MIENSQKEVQEEPVKITRYELAGFTSNPEMIESQEGGWVRHEDYLAEKLNPNGYVLTKDDPAIYRMMQAILDITGDCEQNETFSGWQIQAHQNKETGEYIKLELIATDNLGGVVAPRC